VSLTSGGAAIEFTTDITDGVIVYTDTYVPEDGVMAPPTTLAVPDDPTVTETSSAGLLRLSIELAAYTDVAVRVRSHEAQVTSKYLDDDPLWDPALTLTFPRGTTTVSIPCAPNTTYAVRTRTQDVYGLNSVWSNDI
jgi:hypothetical protein